MINDPVKFAEKLCVWYERNKRSLPFRQTRDPYAILVAETMLQQTRMEVVLDYYDRFLAAFPSVDSLATADIEDVLKVWEGLGYYRRARNLHKAAQIIAKEHKNTWPTDPEGLRGLPGVGAYTAAALAAIAFGKRTPAVDGNVMRIMARIGGMTDDITGASAKDIVRASLTAPMEHADPRTFTEALMEFGALVCKKRPLCEDCPFRDQCFAYEHDMVDVLPVRGAQREKTIETYRTFVVKNARGVLLEKRPVRGLLGGLHTLPQYTKDLDGALATLHKDHGVEVKNVRSLGTVTHTFTHKVWHMEVFLVETDTVTEDFYDSHAPSVALARAHGKILSTLEKK